MVGQELLAGLGLAVGVALLFASQIAGASLNGSVRDVTSQFLGQMQFQLDSRDAQGFEERLLDQVNRLAGVGVAVPVLEERVTLAGPDGKRAVELLGVQPKLALQNRELSHRFGEAFEGLLGGILLPGPVAEQIGIHRPLRSLNLWFDGWTVTARIGGEVSANAIGELASSPVAVASLPYAQRLTGMQGRLTRIFVRARHGRERQVRDGLERLGAGTLNVEPADFDGTLFGVAAAPANQSQSLFSGISALVGFLFAFNAMLLTLPLRRGLVRTLRVNGATRADIVKTLLFDASILGGLASMVGLAFGYALSLAVFRANPGYLSLAFPVGSQRIVNDHSIAVAVGAGFLAACVGVLVALPAGSSRPAMKLYAGRWPSIVLVVGGVTSIAITTLILAISPQTAVLGSVILLLALLLLLPVLLGGLLAVFDRLQACFRSAATRVTVVELRSPKTRARSIAIAATGATAVFGSIALQGAQTNLKSGLARAAHDVAVSADLWIVPSGRQDLLTTSSFRPIDTLNLAGRFGVRAGGLYRASFLDYGDRRVWVLAPPKTAAHPVPPSQLVTGDLALSSGRLRSGGWAVLSQALAAQHHLHIGQSFTLPSPRPMTFRVAALSTNLGWPPGAILLSPSDYQRAWGSTRISAYNILLSPHASPKLVRSQLQRVLGSGSGLVIETAHQREHLMNSITRQGLSRLTQIATLVKLAAILSMAASMGALIWQRRARLARFRVQGYRRKVLHRSFIYESCLLLGGGCAIGAAFGIFGQFLISHALATVTGFPIVFSADISLALRTCVLVGVSAVSIVALLGYRVASADPPDEHSSSVSIGFWGTRPSQRVRARGAERS